MRILYLMRHGEAELDVPVGTRDFDRPLTEHGRELIVKQAETLIANDIAFDGLIASAAARAWQTAEIIAEKLEMQANRCISWPILYSAKIQEVIAVNIPRSWSSTILIGHNPVLSQVAAKLCSEFNEDLDEGQIIGISFPSSQWLWPHAGTLIHNFKSK
ncbi:MAG: hypothetical protein GX801_05060 [Fibrobacter sp.]|nr:hypothetical protein [Fibrobacter sp.]